MKNKIQDLNDHLFAQLERLSDEDITEDNLEKEVKRAESMAAISDQILKAADIRLKAAKLYADYGQAVRPMLPEIGGPADK